MLKVFIDFKSRINILQTRFANKIHLSLFITILFSKKLTILIWQVLKGE